LSKQEELEKGSNAEEVKLPLIEKKEAEPFNSAERKTFLKYFEKTSPAHLTFY